MYYLEIILHTFYLQECHWHLKWPLLAFFLKGKNIDEIIFFLEKITTTND